MDPLKKEKKSNRDRNQMLIAIVALLGLLGIGAVADQMGWSEFFELKVSQEAPVLAAEEIEEKSAKLDGIKDYFGAQKEVLDSKMDSLKLSISSRSTTESGSDVLADFATLTYTIIPNSYKISAYSKEHKEIEQLGAFLNANRTIDFELELSSFLEIYLNRLEEESSTLTKEDSQLLANLFCGNYNLIQLSNFFSAKNQYLNFTKESPLSEESAAIVVEELAKSEAIISKLETMKKKCM